MEREGSGWLLFAATMLGLAGVMRFFDEIWAFRYDGVLPENFEGALFGRSLNTYGWVWLIVAAVLLVSAFVIVSGSQFGRWVGIVAAAVAAISAIWWMPYYPIWALTYIGIAMLAVYGLIAYGSRESVEQAAY